MAVNNLHWIRQDLENPCSAFVPTNALALSRLFFFFFLNEDLFIIKPVTVSVPLWSRLHLTSANVRVGDKNGLNQRWDMVGENNELKVIELIVHVSDMQSAHLPCQYCE